MILRTKLVIIGGGAGGLSLAYEAAIRGIDLVLLDNGRPGTTHAATGILDARPDHLLKDSYSVEVTAGEVRRWLGIFKGWPNLITPKLFHLLIDESTSYNKNKFEVLFDHYHNVGLERDFGLPWCWQNINIKDLEKSEPNLSYSQFKAAIAFWLWTAQPSELMAALRALIACNASAKVVQIGKLQSYYVSGRYIKEVVVITKRGVTIQIQGFNKPLVVVNCAGPAINSSLGQLGINIPVDLRLGVQAQSSGKYFNSNLLSYGSSGYTIFIQNEDYVQIGPTNEPFGNMPRALDSFEAMPSVMHLSDRFRQILKPDCASRPVSLLKYGWRVRPVGLMDTDRPIIWHHEKESIDNLYSLLPGKMVLGLLAGRELLNRASNRGLIDLNNIPTPDLSLDGHSLLNNVRLASARTSSLCSLGFQYIKSRI